MSGSQNQLLTREFFGSVNFHSRNMTTLSQYFRHLAVKMNFTSQTQDLFPHTFHDPAQYIGPDMGLCLI